MMLPQSINHSKVIGGLVFGVGTSAALYYNRKKIVQLLYKWRINSLIKLSNMKVHIVTSNEEWECIYSLIAEEAYTIGALGFDCEWVQVQGSRRPVALLQLATASGVCVLVRLSCMNSIPDSLKMLLNDNRVLKLGVACIEDSQYLLMDYGLNVRGCVDLRHLYFRSFNQETPGENEIKQTANNIGLNGLSQKLLGKSLNKDWRIRAGDWEAHELSPKQIKYAAEDALVGIHILIKLLADKVYMDNSAAFMISSSWNAYVQKIIHQYCSDYSDLKFCSSKDPETNSKTIFYKPGTTNKTKMLDETSVTRKTLLYHNCQLLAPDNVPLCTVDPKKARWYVEKDLGTLVSEEPLVVKLNFEPAGRPQTEKGDGQFYLQERHNKCVVCGKDDSYIRKNIVPVEYRKYFPDILKAHQSHDVVLLCLKCHRKSSMQDNFLRNCLAEEFDAPIGTKSDLTHIVDQNLKRIRNAGGTLLKSGSKLPSEKVAELEQLLKDYYQCDTVTSDLIQKASNLEIKIPNENYEPHGLKVYKAYEKIGITKFERRWREYFLSSMNPNFMPEHWSINHNEYKMELKINRLPIDHPDRIIYKIALVGTEGNLDDVNNH
ncbi:unnamed protein product, partial [Meganyctiphanes norvegica]